MPRALARGSVEAGGDGEANDSDVFGFEHFLPVGGGAQFGRGGVHRAFVAGAEGVEHVVPVDRHGVGLRQDVPIHFRAEGGLLAGGHRAGCHDVAGELLVGAVARHRNVLAADHAHPHVEGDGHGVGVGRGDRATEGVEAGDGVGGDGAGGDAGVGGGHEVDRLALLEVGVDQGVHDDGAEALGVFEEEGLGGGDLTGAEVGFARASGVDAEGSEGGAGVGGAESAEDPFQGGDHVLLLLVGDVVGHLGADGAHGVRTSGEAGEVAGFPGAAAVQDHADLLVSGDLAGGQAAGVGEALGVTGQVGLPVGDVDLVAALGGVEGVERGHYAARQERVADGGGLDEIRRKNLGDNYVGAERSHD
jgi:hypothetical protein